MNVRESVIKELWKRRLSQSAKKINMYGTSFVAEWTRVGAELRVMGPVIPWLPRSNMANPSTPIPNNASPHKGM